MDISYATIPLFGGNKRLYREKRLAYVDSSQDKPENHHIYVVDIDLGSSIFFNDGPHIDPEITVHIELKQDKEFAKRQEYLEKKQNEERLWTMHFDGSISKNGVGDDVYINSPIIYFKSLPYKLNFECTNNVDEYEALFLGLNDLKDMGAKRI